MKKLLCISLGAFIAAAGFSTAFAAGSGGTSTNSEKPKLVCKKGEVVKNVTTNGVKKKKCVKLESSNLADEELYEQGSQLAKDGQYEDALKILAKIQNQDDPRVLNYLGYSNRKAGRLDAGIAYYQKALAIDPDFVLAREYLGEGYVAAGKIDLAKIELAEIEKRCGMTCEEYKDLAEAIATATN
jgi:tetratricopeptide (TPR) repeat protein